MRRREFIGLVGGAAVLPLVGNAQEANRMRRIGVLTGVKARHPLNVTGPHQKIRSSAIGDLQHDGQTSVSRSTTGK